jgi:hypothetical protein
VAGANGQTFNHMHGEAEWQAKGETVVAQFEDVALLQTEAENVIHINRLFSEAPTKLSDVGYSRLIQCRLTQIPL